MDQCLTLLWLILQIKHTDFICVSVDGVLVLRSHMGALCNVYFSSYCISSV
jgi:hypothetical protein